MTPPSSNLAVPMAEAIDDGTTPVDWGAPAKFAQWRSYQQQAFYHGLFATRRHVGIGLATGGGKSTVAFLLAHNARGRTVILTSRIGLAHQYASDFPSVVEIHSRRNYRTEDLYKMQVKRAAAAKVVVTNYQYYFRARSVLGQFRSVICDEAVLAFKEMSNFLSFEASKDQMEHWELGWPQDPNDTESWRAWASRKALPIARAKIAMLKRDYKDADELEAIAGSLETLSAMHGRWVCEGDDKEALVGRVWPGEEAAIHLYPPYIKRIYYLSGTLRPQALRLLGVKNSEMDFVEFPHPIPSDIRPVYWVPTVRVVERTMTNMDRHTWIARIDQLAKKYPGELGLIHTVSYARAKYVKENSKLGRDMYIHNSRDTVRTVDWFRKQKGRGTKILVSPVLTTGWDIPEVRWQCIAKLPFQPATDCITKARMEDDKTFVQYDVAQEIVQQAGRIVRGPAKEDAGDTFIVDDQWEWFGPKNREAMPSWFYVERRAKP